MSKKNCIRGGARHPGLRLTPVALAAMLLAPSAWPATRTWNGGAGAGNPYWDLLANWNTGLPGPGDIAALGAFDTTINSGTWALKSLSGTGTLTMNGGLLSYDAASSLGNLVLNGGSLGGKGTLAVGNFTWAGGSLGNAGYLDGTVNVSGTTTLSSGNRTIEYGQALNLNGNATWAGQGYLYLSGAGDSGGTAFRESSLNLAAGKTLAIQGSDGASYLQITGPGTFNNAGTVTKTGTNTLYIDSKFNNTGTFNVNGGETFFQGTQSLSGAVSVASGATVHFGGDISLAAGATFGGAGNFVFDGSTVVASGTRTFGGAGSKTLSNGYLGGAGTVVLNRLAWTGGTMGYYNAVGGTTTVNGATTLGGGYLDLAFGRKLNLNGDVAWVGSGTLNISGAGSYGGVDYAGSILNLAAGKTFSLQGSSDASTFNIYGTDTSAINNAGTITKTGTNNLVVYGRINNTGTLNVNGGQAWLYTSDALGGTVNVAAGAGLHFGGSTTVFDPAVTIAGDGDLFFDGGYSLLSSGALNFGGAGKKTLVGYLGGAGTMAFNNLTWTTSGAMGYWGAPGGTTTVNGTTTIAGLYPTVAYGRTLNFNGDVNWAGQGSLSIGGAGSYGGVDYVASAVNLAAGGTMRLQGDSGPSQFSISGGGTFNNAGTITKTGANDLYIADYFNNIGTLNLNGGQTYYYGNGTLGGTINVASAAGLHLGGSLTIAPTAVIGGNGSFYFDGPTVVASGTRTFGGTGSKTMTNGSLGGAGTMVFNRLNWTGGSMGDYNAPGGTTTVTGATAMSFGQAYVNYGRTLNLNGGGTWDGAGQLFIFGAGDSGSGPYGASIVKLAAGKSLLLQGSDATDSSLVFVGSGTFVNAGTVIKTGANNLVIASNFTNSGTLSIGNSPAQIASTLFSNTGTVTIAGGLTQIYGSTFNNTGSVIATGGVVQIAGTTFNNTGTLYSNGGRIEVTGYSLAQWNPTSKALTAGTYRVTGNQPIAFDLGYAPGTATPAVIKTNRAKIYLDGAGAALVSTLPEPDVNALKSLATNYGVLSLTGGATQAITGSLKNRGTGTIVVGDGSALTLGGGTAVYNQIDTAATFVGGTLSAKTITLDAGSLSAGLGAGLIGNGTVSASVGGLTFGAAARLDEDVGTAAWDRLTVAAGNVTVDGTLNATFASGAGVGTYRFLTASAGQVLGTFDAITSNLSAAQFSVQAVYGANYVDLQVSAVPTFGTHPPSPTAVPEPQSAALLAAGLAGLSLWARRRQRDDGRARA